MQRRQFGPCYKNQDWTTIDRIIFRQNPLISKLKLTGDGNKSDLSKLSVHTKMGMLAYLSYKVSLRESFQDSQLACFLKKTKGLKDLRVSLRLRHQKFIHETLFNAISLLKLKSLSLTLDLEQTDTPPYLFEDLTTLLKKMRSLEHLDLKFVGVAFPAQFHPASFTLSFKDLTR